MTPHQIRSLLEQRKDYIDKFGKSGETQRNAILVCQLEFLAEIAAQLAESNERQRMEQRRKINGD